MRSSRVFASICAVEPSRYSEIIGNKNGHTLLDQNIAYYIRKNSRIRNKDSFLHSRIIDKRWSFGDLRKQVEYLSRNLLSMGLRPSERVMSFSYGCFENYLLQLACSFLGCMYIAIPPEHYTADKLRSYLNQFQPQILYLSDKYQGQTDHAKFSLYDVLLSVIPELAFSYPGQTVQFEQSQEFPYLKKCIINGRNGEEIKEAHKFTHLLPSIHSYHEDHLGRFNLLLHPDEPILSLWNVDPPLEDKTFTSYSHMHCMNSGSQFTNALGLDSRCRVSFLHRHFSTPLGAIVVPFASLSTGFEIVLQNEDLLRKSPVDIVAEVNQQNLTCFVGNRVDFERIMNICGSEHRLSVNQIAIFEDSSVEETSQDFLLLVKERFKAQDVILFRGPVESCYMVTHRSANQGDLGILPYTGLKVVGDRGTYDAKILSRGVRGNLRLRGPHVTPYYYSNAGLLTEFQDELGWIATSRDGRIEQNGAWIAMKAQIY
ncbi:fatty-acyl-CoA synthase [Perkinsela sp. CCAP 1560/4]|nr:fatty-acyl-CoA synthase [Perkinsela sp. CCAP 1560/4]|eukprot:KNH08229.1 fatty-acyl-CoA synthase [Perkinsela sp. CCAP 1560/4]